jgi:hypothetical protein
MKLPLNEILLLVFKRILLIPILKIYLYMYQFEIYQFKKIFETQF